ncbi:thioredoxin family protein [Pusillimonas sp. ANT_WB101]|uniref:thioredoxin family protein n=1 Tax=Pusillimonas sp. ANT_WB101 TaxID=2597356 RepID=UPI0011EDE2FD|nr:thioredoxin family protein [Pusillimonas sp. ANT_WB101]KAA0890050.1 thioredoxin family protein [Pusillimonas sp. ANT_WB101]
MSVFDPQFNADALLARLETSSGLIVACYCAQWCRSCTEYRPSFDALATRWPQHTFAWIDIEESPELLDDEDVENFPTILMQSSRGNVFFGAMLPHISHLERLIERFDEKAPALEQGPGPLRALLSATT